MSFRARVEKLVRNDFFIAAIVLVIFLIANRYIYGWDDQHVEIPLLKHLIDPTLYKGDYYVESLKQNFTTFLFPLLSKFISVEQIPAAYLTLYLAVRFLFFYWVFKIWELIGRGNRAVAFMCTIGMFLVSRPEEFLYRTFSHEEFALVFIFAAIFYFYKARYALASLLLGIAANFHALYALFPMLYICAYTLLFTRERKWWLFFRNGLIFTVAASPFVIWTFQRAIALRLNADPHLYDNWINLYHLSCPQNFFFDATPFKEAISDPKVILAGIRNYIFLAAFYVFHFVFNKDLREDKRLHATAITALFLTVVTFIFTYLIPSHFILDLNLVRNEQYVRFFLAGYTVILVYQYASHSIWKACLLAALYVLTGGKDYVDVLAVFGVGTVLCFWEALQKRKFLVDFKLWVMGVVFLALAVRFWPIADPGSYNHFKTMRLLIVTAVLLAAAILFYSKRQNELWRSKLGVVIIAIPLVAMFFNYCYLHYTFVQISERGAGFWQLQRNWEEMQRYVKGHTPKDALLMVPNDMEMGGFRIHSDRRILVDYRDCGIIGFDMAAAHEWQKRMQDIDSFKVMIKESFLPAIINGVKKYNVDYIVFMKYAAPPDNSLLQKMYENEAFSLYKVTRN